MGDGFKQDETISDVPTKRHVVGVLFATSSELGVGGFFVLFRFILKAIGKYR